MEVNRKTLQLHAIYKLEKKNNNFFSYEREPPLDHWEETTELDHEGGQKSLVKEAVHIQMTPSEEHFNRDGGLEVSVLDEKAGRSNPH